jgi:hypothetical protein
MFKKFLYLEWKSFFRSASFNSHLAIKIIIGFLAAIYGFLLLMAGIGLFFGLKTMKLDPLICVNKYLIYYFMLDLIVRLFLQNIPVLNIRPLLALPIKKSIIVHFSLGKTALSFFNWLHALFFIPFTIVLLLNGYNFINVIFWHLAIVSIIYINNFLNIILNNKENLYLVFIILIVAAGACQYYRFFDITTFTAPFFDGLCQTNYLFMIPISAIVGLYFYTFSFFKKELFLDAGLSTKQEIVQTENLVWLNKFGTLGTFLKNDIKLIKRNKRAKTTVIMSVFFLFYGLLFFGRSIEAYDKPVMQLFAGIFVSGGFLFTFGQFVPSWDSAYYPLMMTQNIPYKHYLSSKWWLVVIGTCISAILASGYLYFGGQVYLTILVGAIYNIGVNSHLVLLAGAYTKTPIDLASSKGAFGDKKAFNVQTLLLSLPKLLLPLLLYGIGYYLINPNTGLLFVALAGVLGFAFRDKVFMIIEKVYKTEKYKTIDAYKQK